MLFTYHQLLINAKITLIRVYLIFFLLWPKLHQLRLQYKNIVKKEVEVDCMVVMALCFLFYA